MPSRKHYVRMLGADRKRRACDVSQALDIRMWRAQQDSNLRPTPSEGVTLSS